MRIDDMVGRERIGLRGLARDERMRTALVFAVVALSVLTFYWTAAFDVAERYVWQSDSGDWISAGVHFLPWPMDYWDGSGLVPMWHSHKLEPDNPDAVILSLLRSEAYLPLTALIAVAFGVLGWFIGALPSRFRRPQHVATAYGVIGFVDAFIAVALLSVAFLRSTWWEDSQIIWTALVFAGLLAPAGLCIYLLQHAVSVRRVKALLPALVMAFLLCAYVIALLAAPFISSEKTLGLFLLAPVLPQIGLLGWALESKRLHALFLAVPIGVVVTVWAIMALAASNARWEMAVNVAEWVVPGSGFKYLPFTTFAPAFVLFLVAAVVDLTLAYWMRRSGLSEARRLAAAA